MSAIYSHLKIIKDCSNASSGCFYDDVYKSLGVTPRGKLNYWGYPAVRLADGMSFYIQGHSGGYGEIIVDLNGNKPPNQLGTDTFYFIITKNGVMPAGSACSQLTYYNIPVRCKKSSTDPENGSACTAWVIAKENMDYLKQDIDW